MRRAGKFHSVHVDVLVKSVTLKPLKLYYTAVSGDANFSMDVVALTIGGFTQPTVTRNLIDLQASVEKGLLP